MYLRVRILIVPLTSGRCFTYDGSLIGGLFCRVVRCEGLEVGAGREGDDTAG